MNVLISTSRPPPEGYPVELVTVGDHVRKKRMDFGLFQYDAARIIGVSTGAVESWEICGHEPHPRAWPGVIKFLGYEPFASPETTAEIVKATRRRLGITSRELANRLKADPGSIARWEAGGEIRKERHRDALQLTIANHEICN